MSGVLIDEPAIIQDGLLDLATRMRRENGCDGDDAPGCVVCDWANELERWAKKLPGLKVSCAGAAPATRPAAEPPLITGMPDSPNWLGKRAAKIKPVRASLPVAEPPQESAP